MRKCDRIVGGILCLVGSLAIFESWRIWNGWNGTGIMALIVGCFLILLSTVAIVFTSGEHAAFKPPEKGELLRIFYLSISFVLYILIMKWCGYLISTWLFLMAITRLISREGTWRNTIIWTGAVALGTYIVFKTYLHMYLPAGFISF